MKLISLLLTIIILINSASAVTLSNDDYAVEVVLNKPGTSYISYNLDKIQGLVIQNNKYTAPSQYSQELAAIFNYETSLTTGSPAGLSIRLQLPTKISEISIPFINFVSLIDNAELKGIQEGFYQGWQITCTQEKCNLKKQKTELTIIQTSKNRFDVIIESYDRLTDSGVTCFSKYGNNLCIAAALKTELSSALNYIGFVSSFEKLLTSYSVTSVGNKVVNSLIPDTNLKPDWQEAMRQELVSLKRKNIINIEDKDIEEIAVLTQKGKAGKNNRIIYNPDSESYDYYYKTAMPVLAQELDSKPFSFLIANIVANPISNPYYLIPIVLTTAFLTISLILIIVARIITKRKRQRKLHPTGLLSQG